jgi:hypothetical protein
MTVLQTPATAATTENTGGSRPQLTTVLILAGLAVLSGAGLAIAYRGGLRVSTGDPIAYLSMARSLAAGHGASVPYGDAYTASLLTAGGPVSHWPVGYPLLLSLDTGSLLSWARVLAVATYAANVFLFGLLALRVGVARVGAIALAVIFAGLSFALHGTVASEPLFFLLILLGLHAFVRFFNRPAVLPILVVAISFGLATVTRFLGEAFVIGGALAVLLFMEERFRQRLGYAVLVAIVGNIPFLIWFTSVHNSPETLGVHLLSTYDTKTILYTFAGFIVPGVQSVDLRILLAAVIVIVVVAILAAVGSRGSLLPVRSDKINWLMLLLAVVYLLFLFFARSVVDPLIQLNARMLFLPFMLFVLWCAQNWPRLASWSAVPRNSWAPTLATTLVGLLVVTAIWTAVEAGRSAQAGSVAAPSSANTALLRAVAGVPANAIIYSNEPDEVYFLSGRTVYLLPDIRSSSTLKKNPSFASDMSTLEQRVCGKPATVLFSSSKDTIEPSLARVKQDLKVASVRSIPQWKVLTLDTATGC